MENNTLSSHIITKGNTLIDAYMEIEGSCFTNYTNGWNHIMPVWLKIAEWGLSAFPDKWKCTIAGNGILIQVGQYGLIYNSSSNNINDLWSACVAFIKWFNNQNDLTING